MKGARPFLAACVSSACIAFSPPAAAEEDTAAMAGGITLMSVGGLGVLGGGIAYVALSVDGGEYRTEKTASILGAVLGGAAIAGGVPLFVVSRQKHGMPEASVGVGSATLRWAW